MARRSQWLRGLRRRSAAARLLRIVGSNPTGNMDVCLLLVLSGQIEVSATGRSLVQSSLTDCDVSCVIWKPHE